VVWSYFTVHQTTFGYACELWDNCGIGNSQKLEQLQLEAARIVTGLPTFTKTEILYRETGWELLSVRRRRRKLQLFLNNMVNENTLIIFYIDSPLHTKYISVSRHGRSAMEANASLLKRQV